MDNCPNEQTGGCGADAAVLGGGACVLGGADDDGGADDAGRLVRVRVTGEVCLGTDTAEALVGVFGVEAPVGATLDAAVGPVLGPAVVAGPLDAVVALPEEHPIASSATATAAPIARTVSPT